jgi:hypothetical protein
MLQGGRLLILAVACTAVTIPEFNRNSWVYQDGTELKIDGKKFTTSGANVYWLVR